jgi:preprotein translocase subunit SecE
MAMARRTEEHEEDLIDEVEELDEEEEVESRPAAPAVSDSRRRRQMKRGEVVTAEAPSQPVRKDRPTPSQREEPTPTRNPIVRFVRNVREYLRETQAELQKVSWPTREDTIRLTGIVISVTVASAVFLGFVSLLFSVLTTGLADANNKGFAAIIAVGLTIVVAGLWLFRDRLFGSIE